MTGHDSVEQIPDGKRQRWLKGLPILGVIWLAEAVCDRLWFTLDRSISHWDAADYLTGTLTYWQALQTPQWFSGEWWLSLWQLSTKIPPLVYISTAPFLNWFGTGPDQSTLVFLLYSAILLGSVYTLGTFLFTVPVGLWAAGLCVLMPGLYRLRLEFLLDYPLTAMVTLCFTCLTVWWGVGGRRAEDGGRKVEGVGEQGSKESRKQGELPLHRFIASSLHRLPPSSVLPPPSSLLRPPSSVLPPPSSLLPWLLAALVGITFGLALMTKQPALFFLLVPLVWVTGSVLWQRAWGRLAQLVVALVVSLPVFYPWYRTNWLLILTSSKRATIDSAIAEGTPSFFSIDAWTLYLRNLPGMVSLPLLVVPLLGLVFFWRRSRVGSQRLGNADYAPKPQEYRQQAYAESQRALGWLLLFLVSSYVLSNLNPNKDDRYVAPYLPVLAVILAYGLTLLPKSWRLLHWGSVALAGFLMIANLFPVFTGAGAAYRQYPTLNYPYQGTEFPHAQVVAEVVRTAPYLRSTIGVLPSTAKINQHNINYYGLLQNFQVFGRQVGTRKSHLEQDRRSLPWFLTKTGDQGSIRTPDIQAAIVQAVEQETDFQLHKTWSLPDRSTLKLYRRNVPLIEVKLDEGERRENSNLQSPISNLQSSLPTPIQLDEITVPTRTPPGKPIPVTYRWSGTWDSLQSGLVILTWKRQGEPAAKGTSRWLHDHGIGMGELYPDGPRQATKTSRFRVIERMAMLPPADAAPGTYALKAMYLDRRTGKATAIAAPPITLQIDPEAIAIPAPELDLVTQFRIMANTLPQGIKALDKIFDRVARINQYDPIQDYVPQAQRAMEYRLQQEPKNRQFTYGLALAAVLRRQVDPAIAAMQQVTQLDPKNPYAYAYLAFVNLYDFRPKAAQVALDRSLKLNSNIPEIHILSGVAALMRGNLVRAWSEVQAYQQAESRK